MQNRLKLGLALIVLFTINPAAAIADSDGYFCIGENYLAYEFQLGRHRTNSSAYHDEGHILTIARASGSMNDVVAIEEIPLESFQTHGMVCEDGSVTIFSFKNAFRVDLSDNSVSEVSDAREGLGQLQTPTLGAQPSPTMRTEVKVFPLENWSDKHDYELHITHHTISDKDDAGSGLRHYTLSRIVRISPGYDHAGSYVIFDGFHSETID